MNQGKSIEKFLNKLTFVVNLYEGRTVQTSHFSLLTSDFVFR